MWSSWDGPRRKLGPEMERAATQAPVAPRTGAATAERPTSISSIAVA